MRITDRDRWSVTDPRLVRLLRCEKACDVSALPRSLDGARFVVLADVRNRFTSGHAVEHRHASESCACPSATASTRDLHALRGSAVPGIVQRVSGVEAVGGQSEVRPADPPSLPCNRLRLLGKQVGAEVRGDTLWRGTPQATATHKPA